MKKLRIIVGGFLGLLPAGGVTWDYVQYPVGLAELGHDVFYIEDTRLWSIYQKEGSDWGDCSASVEHLKNVCEWFGLSNRWAYRDEASGGCFGLSLEKVYEICRTADVFINISCANVLRDEYMKIPVRALIDSDPMFTQIQAHSQAVFTPGQSGMRRALEGHTHHFTFGENVGHEDCRMPPCGVDWKPTRQPVCLRYWHAEQLEKPDAPFTTLMNWTAAPPLDFEGEMWGQKDIEFNKFINVPQRMRDVSLCAETSQDEATSQIKDVSFAVAVGQTSGAPFPFEATQNHGWQVLDPRAVAGDWMSYQRFIADSRGEFSVAKETYVKARTGWFSCRSACYLAAGRPVVTQDTGWTKHLPHDGGLLAFDTEAQAIEALRRVVAEPEKHACAARAIAEECFDSNLVLSKLLNDL